MMTNHYKLTTLRDVYEQVPADKLSLCMREIIEAAKREQEEQEAARRAAQSATTSPAPDTREAATTEGTAVTPAPSQREAAPQDTTAQQEAGQASTQGTEANPRC